MKKTTQTYHVSPAFQKLFIATGFVAVCAQSIPILTHMAKQYSSNPNMSGFYSFLTSSLALPLVCFTIAYFGSRSIKPELSRLFHASILTTVALFLYTIVWQGIMYVSLLTEAVYDRFVFEVIPVLIVLVALTAYVFLLRKKR